MFKASATVLGLLLCFSLSAPLMAQTTAVQDIIQTERPPSNTSISGFAADFLNDQKDIWTSPFHLKAADTKWLAPAAIGAGTLAIFDHRISNSVKSDTSLRGPSNAISTVGEIAPYAVPGTMWFLGAKQHDSHLAETGRLAVEAELDSEVVMNVLKIATGRMRPNQADSKSFPSGHAMSNFAMAAVLSREYHDKPLVVFGSYGFATAVSLARVGGLNHFPSDVLVGAVLGELIGRYVVHHHARLAEE
jgi:membrane-associated phospholipid phosphatase